MKLPLIILFIFLVTALEALTDGLIYHAWVTYIPGEWNHLTQLLTYSAYFAFGYLWFKNKNFLWMVLAALLIRFAWFDLFYCWFSGQCEPGENSVWDSIYKAVPILLNPLFRLLFTVPAIYILIKYHEERNKTSRY